MVEQPARKRGRPVTRQEDWESTQKQIHLSNSIFERWQVDLQAHDVNSTLLGFRPREFGKLVEYLETK